MTSEIANLPKGWVRTNLTAIAQVIRGVSFPKDQKSPLPQEGFLGCLRTTNVQREVEWSDMLFVPRRFIRRQEQLVRLNDILISTANSLELVGKVALIRAVPFVTTIGAFIAIIRVHPDINPKFVYFQITSSDIQSHFRQTASTTTNISNISTSNVLNSLLRIPPFPEQHRIVAKIEELFTRLDAGVEALKKIQAQLRRYRQAVLKHAFEGNLTAEWRQAHKDELEPASALLERIKQERQSTVKDKYKELPPLDTSDLFQLPEGWVWARIGAIVESMQNGIYKQRHFYSADGVACLRMYNIQDGKILWKDIKRMNLTADEIERYRLIQGDILVNRVNSRELVGKTATIPSGLETCVYESKNIRIRLFEGVESKYIAFWFQIFAQGFFNRNAQQTVGMASINQQQIASMPIPFTVTAEQHQIVSEIERRFSVADQIERTVDHSLKQVERLRQSILKRAFEGNLVPQDRNDEPAEMLLERIRQGRASQQAERKPAKSSRNKLNTKQIRLA